MLHVQPDPEHDVATEPEDDDPEQWAGDVIEEEE